MVSTVIVAAGKGLRMNHSVPKQYLLIAGRPVLGHTLLVFDACELIDEVFVVVSEEDFGFCQNTLIAPLNLKKKINLVRGGTERQDSVYNGLRALSPKTDTVVIHDGVRPFVGPEELAACITAAEETGACILGIPVSDTLKHVEKSGHIEQTLARDNIWMAQTPQVFQYELILKAHEAARRDGFRGTDDALLLERLGIDVKIIPGSKTNIKITTPQDLALAEAILTLE
ncbi:MAG: 2-C-methyl-D-erythritol 4-phosphate cytidylyltransferase [Candidatus Desulfatibia sp.]|uniref:2-C-methyl-D-erythritol 4-phosphate cytidylyltransferase n=1 Tax=Candidatus Desulfatibia sp. TaxID=3101189 RepID=UPI002F2ECB3F